MAVLPVVAGLLKHQVYHPDPRTGKQSALVTTFWTWRNEPFPVDPARVAYEQGALDAWVKGATYRTAVSGPDITADWIKTWDFGVVPPLRANPLRVWPRVAGTGNKTMPPQVCQLVALRTQPVGSAIVNRLNGRIYHARCIGSALGGFWDTATRGWVSAAYNVVLASLDPGASADSGDWVVPCFWEAGLLRVGGPLLPPVDHLIVRTDVAVRRTKLYHPGPYGRGT